MEKIFKKLKRFLAYKVYFFSKDFIGRWGENQACKFLRKNNVFIETQNLKSRISELDIIGFSSREIYFVEVKTRNFKNALNFPIFETINEKKISHIRRGIKIYLNNNFHIIQRRRILNYRIDFIFIHYTKNFFGFPKVKEIIWKKNPI